MVEQLRHLSVSLDENTAAVQAQVPADFDLRPKLRERLQQILDAAPKLSPRLKR